MFGDRNEYRKIYSKGKEKEIVWNKEELGFKTTNGKENYGIEFGYLPCLEDIKIVGNIFDNPELLRGRTA